MAVDTDPTATDGTRPNLSLAPAEGMHTIPGQPALGSTPTQKVP
jgi:hypothetical protein